MVSQVCLPKNKAKLLEPRERQQRLPEGLGVPVAYACADHHNGKLYEVERKRGGNGTEAPGAHTGAAEVEMQPVQVGPWERCSEGLNPCCAHALILET